MSVSSLYSQPYRPSPWPGSVLLPGLMLSAAAWQSQNNNLMLTGLTAEQANTMQSDSALAKIHYLHDVINSLYIMGARADPGLCKARSLYIMQSWLVCVQA